MFKELTFPLTAFSPLPCSGIFVVGADAAARVERLTFAATDALPIALDEGIHGRSHIGETITGVDTHSVSSFSSFLSQVFTFTSFIIRHVDHQRRRSRRRGLTRPFCPHPFL